MDFIKYEEWIKDVPDTFKEDSLWKMKAYRLSLFLGDISWNDISILYKDGRTKSLANQLYRASGSIGANLSEGYSRGTGKDRARFYEYSLGSAREVRDWYYKGRHILGDEILKHRLLVLTEIIKLLLIMVPEQRLYSIKEPISDYETILFDAPILINRD